MRGTPTTFWGKLGRTDTPADEEEWHPLIDHCADVAATMEALLGLPVWQRRLGRLAGCELSSVDRARLSVLAALHDVGKFNIGFQAKGRPELGATAGHVQEAVAALNAGRVLRGVIEAITPWGDGADLLLLAAICHHGRPYTLQSVAPKWQATWWRKSHDLDPDAGCNKLLALCRGWFPEAFKDHHPLPYTTAFGHAFAGTVMLADWIGSDTRFFRYSDHDADRMPYARTSAHEAISQLDLDIPLDKRADALQRDAFARVAPEGCAARDTQSAITTLHSSEHGGLTILEAETGSGKTEAALARFVQLFDAGLVDGLYFALPTRTAATQLHARVRAAAKRAFTLPPPVILAVPGYLRVDDVEGRRLAPFEVHWSEDSERLRYHGWAAEAAKRFLVGCLVVGTVDQVLLSSLMVGHAHLRASALLRHLLVVDEVHASDAYMQRVLEHVLQRHLAAGGHALLLSATLGAEARARLTTPGRRPTVLPLDEAIATPYPLLTHKTSGLEVLAPRASGMERSVLVQAESWMDLPERVAERALAAAAAGAKTLVIRNTVTDCLATHRELERLAETASHLDLVFACKGRHAPHHARFARQDRVALDLALEARFGRDRPDGGCVVVATQTVQQSLDLDADFLISDLCPADVLLQRIGRLHRHARPRPGGYGTPAALVVVPSNRALETLIKERGVAHNHHGLGSVYPDLRIIEATWSLIEALPEWRIPAMNRLLVERSLHSVALAEIVHGRDARWHEHAIAMAGLGLGQGRLAELNVVDWQRDYADSAFPSSSDQRIPTRLGESDRLARFDTAPLGPFGNPIEELVLPAWWTRGLAADLTSATSVVQDGSSLRFELGPFAFLYDRLGLQRGQKEEYGA